ncbi:hypothetical protein SLS62_004453 [Diatrype stigma]|uniref:Fungal-specific transcription factor domain-containing protein n=1 Tax=Diatrype stigma TaxID=117547 RepID=A0AAN9UWL4_9PEZI
MWLHRARALSLLRTHINQLASERTQQADWGDSAGQVIASTVMMTFFEISRDCSDSWTMHADFARNFLSSHLRKVDSLSAEQETLFKFAATYFVSHDVLAGTGGTCMEAAQMNNELCESMDNLSVMAITGCSRDLLSLISEITQIGSSVESYIHPRILSATIQQRRDNIDSRLHGLRQEVPEEFGSFQSELVIVSEVKRLAAILYLYSRIDGSGPHEPHVVRVTHQIMALIPQISLRTHTGLWPLFIVATLGIRSECDEDRKLLLSHLTALQETRQLANVKKARRIIEGVWKARDLRPDEPQGWAILQGRRHGPISLA